MLFAMRQPQTHCDVHNKIFQVKVRQEKSQELLGRNPLANLWHKECGFWEGSTSWMAACSVVAPAAKML